MGGIRRLDVRLTFDMQITWYPRRCDTIDFNSMQCEYQECENDMYNTFLQVPRPVASNQISRPWLLAQVYSPSRYMTNDHCKRRKPA